MKFLLELFNKKNNLAGLTNELKKINENSMMGSDERLRKILANVEAAQGIISIKTKA